MPTIAVAAGCTRRRSSEIEIGPSRVTSTQSRGASVRSAMRILANSTTKASPIAAAPSWLCALRVPTKTCWYPVSANQSQSV